MSVSSLVIFPIGQLTEKTKREMKKIGIVAIEVVDPSRVVRVMPNATVIPGDNLTLVALESLAAEQSSTANAAFVKKMADLLRSKIDVEEKTMSVDASKMTAAEYAAFTGQKSYPAGAVKAAGEVAESRACQAADADYVARFMRHIEDPDMRLVTEKPGDWSNWGANGKAAILAALRQWRDIKEGCGDQ